MRVAPEQVAVTVRGTMIRVCVWTIVVKAAERVSIDGHGGRKAVHLL